MIRRLTPVLCLAFAALPLLSGPARAESLRLDSFFDGSFSGTGSVDNMREGTHRTFKATMTARWEGPHGTLTEDLVYDDGEQKHFVWSFEKGRDGRYAGRRDDLLQDADIFQDGDAVRMKYTARTRLPSGKVYTLSFDDRLTQISPDTVTMTGDVSYLFIGVGTTHMTINKTGR